MKIEQFIALSEGEWTSMRSSHSLAFKQFEQVVSKLRIKALLGEDTRVIELLKSENIKDIKPVRPCLMEWQAESDWGSLNNDDKSSGSCILIPLPQSNTNGMIIRSVGYTEKIRVLSLYTILEDGTVKFVSHYDQSICEERIWFASDNLRCRSSVLRTSKGKGILQTTYASEIRKIQIQDDSH